MRLSKFPVEVRGPGVAIFSFGPVALGPLVFIFTVEDAVLLVGLVGYAIWWAHELHRGSTALRPALGMHLLIYGLLAAYVFSSGVLALSRAGLTPNLLRASWYLVPVEVPFLVSIAAGHRFAAHRPVVERIATGRWTHRGAAAVPFLWLLLWLVRLGLEDGPLKGYSVFTGPWLGVAAPASVPALTFCVVLSVVVGVYFLSFGFLIGFSAAVRGSFRRTRSAFEAELPARRAPAARPASIEPFSGGSPRRAAQAGVPTTSLELVLRLRGLLPARLPVCPPSTAQALNIPTLAWRRRIDLALPSPPRVGPAACGTRS